MNPFDGSLARRLDFGDLPAAVTSTAQGSRTGLRLAPRASRAAGPEKYRQLEARRRHAQMRARRLLGLMDDER